MTRFGYAAEFERVQWVPLGDDDPGWERARTDPDFFRELASVSADTDLHPGARLNGATLRLHAGDVDALRLITSFAYPRSNLIHHALSHLRFIFRRAKVPIDVETLWTLAQRGLDAQLPEGHAHEAIDLMMELDGPRARPVLEQIFLTGSPRWFAHAAERLGKAPIRDAVPRFDRLRTSWELLEETPRCALADFAELVEHYTVLSSKSAHDRELQELRFSLRWFMKARGVGDEAAEFLWEWLDEMLAPGLGRKPEKQARWISMLRFDVLAEMTRRADVGLAPLWSRLLEYVFAESPLRPMKLAGLLESWIDFEGQEWVDCETRSLFRPELARNVMRLTDAESASPLVAAKLAEFDDEGDRLVYFRFNLRYCKQA